MGNKINDLPRLYAVLYADLASWYSRDGQPPTPDDVLDYAFRLAVLYLEDACELTDVDLTPGDEHV